MSAHTDPRVRTDVGYVAYGLVDGRTLMSDKYREKQLDMLKRDTADWGHRQIEKVSITYTYEWVEE